MDTEVRREYAPGPDSSQSSCPDQRERVCLCRFLQTDLSSGTSRSKMSCSSSPRRRTRNCTPWQWRVTSWAAAGINSIGYHNDGRRRRLGPWLARATSLRFDLSQGPTVVALSMFIARRTSNLAAKVPGIYLIITSVLVW